MAVAPVVSISSSAPFDQALREERLAMVESVVGTMGAEGEPPSTEAIASLQRFIEGELTLEEMSESILTIAHRKVHEATARRLTV